MQIPNSAKSRFPLNDTDPHSEGKLARSVASNIKVRNNITDAITLRACSSLLCPGKVSFTAQGLLSPAVEHFDPGLLGASDTFLP